MAGENRLARRVLVLLLALAAVGVLLLGLLTWLGWWGPILRALGLA